MAFWYALPMPSIERMPYLRAVLGTLPNGRRTAPPARLIGARGAAWHSDQRARSWPYGLLVLALGLWALGLTEIDVYRMNDFGLISVLPAPVLGALVLLTGGAILLLRADRPDVLAMLVYIVTLVVMLYGIPVFVEQVARSSVNWVHEGFIEYIRRTGAVAPSLEARFNWPGFFILAAFVADAAGINQPVTFANLAPVYFNLLYLLPLAMIFRAFTQDMRLVWAGLWLFALGNWVGQDYFSPQALAYFLDLVIVGVVLTWFRVAQPRSERVASWLRIRGPAGRAIGRLYGLATPDDERPRPLGAFQQVGLIAASVVTFAFIAYSHQLTPFFLTAGLLGLVALNRASPRGLPIVFGIMTVAWVSYMTVPFLVGHVAPLLAEVGRLGDTVGSNLVKRIQGSPDHQAVVTIRLVFTVGVWAVAALGALVRLRDGRRDLSLIVLAVAPVPLLGLQAYGGELILRLYLFTLPMAAFFVAGLLYGRPDGAPSRLRRLLAGVAVSVVILVFFVTRYGNERADLMTAAEVQAVDRLYAIAPSGSLLVAASNNLPWKFKDFEKYTYLPEADNSLVGQIDQITTLMADPKYPASYLILTRSQGNYAEVFLGLAPGAWTRFVAAVRASPTFIDVYHNADADIFVPSKRSALSAAP
jgi:hypothetical protein